MTNSHLRYLPPYTKPRPRQKTLKSRFFLLFLFIEMFPFNSLALCGIQDLTYCLDWTQSSCSWVSIKSPVRLPNLTTSFSTVILHSWPLKIFFTFFDAQLYICNVLHSILHVLYCHIYVVHNLSKTEIPLTILP